MPNTEDILSSDSEEDEESDEQTFEDWAEDESPLPTRTLLNPNYILPTPQAALENDRQQGLDLEALIGELQLNRNFYGCIKIVNFIRGAVQDDCPINEILSRIRQDGPSGFLCEGDDTYLQPIYEEDPLLFALSEVVGSLNFDNDCETMRSCAQSEAEHTQEKSIAGEGHSVQLQRENAALKAEVAHLRLHLNRLIEVTSAVDSDVKIPRPRVKDADSSYFGGYASAEIHETMLRDRIRTLAYQKAISAVDGISVKGKIVLDVGCGTGVLSIFAAKAGAAGVIGVDNSGIINLAAEVVKANGLDGVITLRRGKIENIDLPVDKVDVLVSEWMGYCLVFEEMLDSVIQARNRFLQPQSGLMLPSSCRLMIQGMTDKHSKVAYWRDCYDIDMRALRQRILADASVEVVPPDSLITSPGILRHIDMYTVQQVDLAFEAPFELEVTQAAPLHGLVLYFDAFFDGCGTETVVLSTGPESQTTHWAQTALWIAQALDKEIGEVMLRIGDKLEGHVRFQRGAAYRDYDIALRWAACSREGQQLAKGHQAYALRA